MVTEMKIAFFVNDINTETEGYTTTRLSMQAHNRGHDVYYITPDDFALDPDNLVRARAKSPLNRKYKSRGAYIKDLKSKASTERITVTELDILISTKFIKCRLKVVVV